uniref:CS domain-containing protein n=1 Tax=Acrobeloides nanus TaxID=290746 RepID=A0A914C2K6_9BILA
MTNIHCQTKYDWYQTEEFVFIAIRQKGLSSADCSVAYDGYNLTVSAHDQVIFSAPLCHPINKESITLTCTPSKIEVKLKKITGERWASLSVEEEEKRPSVSTKNWNVIEKEAENEEDSSDVQSLFHV